MTQSSDDSRSGTMEPSPNWTPALVWSAFAVVGWVAFELTAQPAVGAVVFCSRFGWGDFLTGLWLCRTDPHRARARACCWFCLALGMARILVASFAMSFAVVGVMDWLQGGKLNQNPNVNMPDAFNGLVILMLAGIPILALFGILGSLAARRGGTRVWLDESLSRARRHKVWPPDLPSSGLVSPTQNKARLVWLTMLAIVIMGALVASVAVMIAVSKAAGALLLVAAFFLISRLSQGVLARHPSDCWSLPHHGT